jgi:nitrate ABC transporter ATP-binding subunit
MDHDGSRAMIRPYLEFSHVSKRYDGPAGASVVLDGVRLALAKGEFVSLIGHSGCGKSTALMIAAGLVEPTGGGVILEGRLITEPGPDRGVVFQSPCLLPWMTALENVALGLARVLPGEPPARRRAVAEHYLAKVGMADARHARAATLSVGMQQRVGLARAFALRPKLLLLDEPFGMLDCFTRADLQETLLEVWHSERITALMVTHDIDEALFLSDRIAMMTNGPGARVDEVLAVPFERPRRRVTLLEHPDYYRLRGALIGFLEEGGRPAGPEPSNPTSPPAAAPRRHARGRAVARVLTSWIAAASCAVATESAVADQTVWQPREDTTVSIFGSALGRVEAWDWFEAGGDVDNEYIDAFETVRLGLKAQHPHLGLVAEGQLTQFQNLPGDAVAPAPRGALGIGALYFQHAGERSPTGFFLKHLYADVKDIVPGVPGVNVRLGRFAYSDGLETATGRAKIDWVKRVRGSERLIGPFGWSAFQRSFDGVQASVEQPWGNVTTMVSHPTQGGFEEKAGESMEAVWLLASSVTLKPSSWLPNTSPRLFFIRYDDDRNVSQRVDNVATAAPKVDVAVNTYGAELAGAYPMGPGEVDLLAWLSAQDGEWYELDHRAIAWALEGGYQWTAAPWTPHLRGGWLYGSGDDEPGDGRHGTFFQVLPTGRKFALLPFYNQMNSSDLFAQVLVKPAKPLTVRLDYHAISLAERNDRWYVGSGATQERGQLFGYVGRNGQGKRGVGQLIDASVTYSPTPTMSVNGYYGHVIGGSVVQAIYAGTSANFGSVEVEVKF